jgi:hypothetical protein
MCVETYAVFPPMGYWLLGAAFLSPATLCPQSCWFAREPRAKSQ